QMTFVLQDGGSTGDVVVVYKAQQVLAAVQCPVFRSELPQQRVGDFKQVVAVAGGVKTFVALVVGAGVQHLVVDDLVVIAVQHFADQHKVRLQLLGEGA